ncbi:MULTISPECIES: MaoC/PaaZ C-terminal domain-containing protein [unclassified Saccharopolyspora]|uniref:MaoC/PaaZ C-terminal domain-containing protein n=1 Tax=unclassified Saccharopolyspora TaxID=2646250 RepID=UPI001CD619DC|nr:MULTISPECIES: MaoC/PaaZ C-terminal domain-containing protein [unclassified Saccharopolyspora]MCA1189580.1 MaoC family dehydratase N-terminal domain-containing protein [Saccharopolyspora sp. 6T]MCA1281721.1 MaoC family dehydratase N-terminal domain-containing protein [Saccharopolyspora sp. 7B]
MPIDPDLAIGATVADQDVTWTESDVLLYHLALGAGDPPTDPGELRYAYEQDLHVLPTFAVVAPNLRQFEPPALSFPGVEVDLAKVLHGSQEITPHRPLPVSGGARATTRIVDVLDKGKAAVIVQETVLTDAAGPLCSARSMIFARGEGGFGGHRGATPRVELPRREPDLVVDSRTEPRQALLYRLCGDRNPLHADPAFAAAAGFERPILHGLCTYGVVCKSIVDTVLDGEVARVASFGARFAGVVHPGETLRTRVWTEPGGELLATTTVPERDDTVVLDGITLTTR